MHADWLLKLGIVCTIHLLRVNVFVKDFFAVSREIIKFNQLFGVFYLTGLVYTKTK